MGHDRITRHAAAFAAGLWVAAGAAAPAAGPPAASTTIAAASDLQFALDEIAAAFARDRGARVRIVYGSSGTLTRQIRDGAPFELFLSADEGFVAQLARAGLARNEGALYAVGRIVLFAPVGSPLDPREGLDGLGRLLDRRGVTRFAIANPAHAPYGRAAEAALRASGLWSRMQPHLVLGDNVSQAAQFATTGNAVGGILAYSLALAPSLRPRGTFALIPSPLHAPLRQRMALLRRAGPVAERFYAYLQEPAARAIFRRYGFELPHEPAQTGHGQAPEEVIRRRAASSVGRQASGRQPSVQRAEPPAVGGCDVITLHTSSRDLDVPEAGSPRPEAAGRRVPGSAAC